jgi:hypothetical protein
MCLGMLSESNRFADILPDGALEALGWKWLQLMRTTPFVFETSPMKEIVSYAGYS